MLFRAVAFVFTKAILGEFVIELAHDAITRHFGEDRGGHHLFDTLIGSDDGLDLLYTKLGVSIEYVAIGLKMREYLVKSMGDGSRKPPMIYELVIYRNYVIFRRSSDALIKFFSLQRSELFGIVQFVNPFCKNHSSHHQRPCQWSSPSFVDTADSQLFSLLFLYYYSEKIFRYNCIYEKIITISPRFLLCIRLHATS